MAAMNRSVSLCVRHKMRRFHKIWVACDPDLLKIGGFLSALVLCVILFLWICLRDACDTDTLIEQLCSEYEKGSIAGPWCYDICVVKSINFYGGCVDHSDTVATFHYKGSLVKIPISTSDKTFFHHSNNRNLKEPISVEEFQDILKTFLHSKLGPTDISELLDKIYSFADFSHNGEISYGEANSVWQLLNNHEFFLMFLFQENLVFPLMNGTCGGLYSFEHVGQSPLFVKRNRSFLDYFFSNTYRWTLPDWERRTNIATSLLEYVTTTSEIYNVKFMMCDIDASRFGRSDLYEAKLISYDHIVSEYSLENFFKKRKCRLNSDCVFKRHCESFCNSSSGLCSEILRRPSMVAICNLVQDYLAFDAPFHIKDTLLSKLRQCGRISKELESISGRNMYYYDVQYNIVLGDIQELLWSQIKNKDPSWLKPKPTKVMKHIH